VIGLPTISIQWRIAAAADFLGTGHADLVWENAVTGEHSIWVLNNGVPANVISLPTSPIQFLPTCPEEFAKPSEYLEVAELSRSRGVSIELPAMHTIRARCL
jgi:hypothetical protein